VAAAITMVGGAAHAQGYPNRAITVIIPFAGGSASDVVARIMLDRMSKNMGHTIVIENRPGAGGNSGTGAAAKSTPDGYTLVGGGSGPVERHALQGARLRPREGPGDDRAVRGLHHRRGGEREGADPFAQGTG